MSMLQVHHFDVYSPRFDISPTHNLHKCGNIVEATKKACVILLFLCFYEYNDMTLLHVELSIDTVYNRAREKLVHSLRLIYSKLNFRNSNNKVIYIPLRYRTHLISLTFNYPYKLHQSLTYSLLVYQNALYIWILTYDAALSMNTRLYPRMPLSRG